MNKIKVILILGFVLVACGQQPEPLMPLSKDMPNTVTLPNGEVVYKLDGEWDCTFQADLRDLQKDVVTISQNGNTFVGIYRNGHQYKAKGDEAIKGELFKNGFKSLYVSTGSRSWKPATWKISENCNKIITDAEVLGINLHVTLTRKEL